MFSVRRDLDNWREHGTGPGAPPPGPSSTDTSSTLRAPVIAAAAADTAVGAAAAARPAAHAPSKKRIRLLAAAGLLAVAAAGGFYLLKDRILAPSKPAAKAVTLLVADFENATAEEVFEGTLESTFSLALEGASFISCYRRGDARRAAAQIQKDAARLDEKTAQAGEGSQGGHIWNIRFFRGPPPVRWPPPATANIKDLTPAPDSGSQGLSLISPLLGATSVTSRGLPTKAMAVVPERLRAAVGTDRVSVLPMAPNLTSAACPAMETK